MNDNICHCLTTTMSSPGVTITSLIVVIQISNQATAGGLLERCHKLLTLLHVGLLGPDNAQTSCHQCTLNILVPNAQIDYYAHLTSPIE